MSNLAKMLVVFCPNGVELIKVVDVTTVARGISRRVTRIEGLLQRLKRRLIPV